jgi:thymidylate kinase
VLADRNQSNELESILTDIGFKRFIAPPLRRYPGIEDFLGFDAESGRIVHLHLHYELTIGEQHLKGYHAPWEAEVLKTRLFDPEHGIFVASPAAELLLLLVRTALKRRWRDPLRKLIARHDTTKKSDFEREFDFLSVRADRSETAVMAIRLLGLGGSKHLQHLLLKPKSSERCRKFASALRTDLQVHRTYGRLEAAIRAWIREFQWLLDGLSRRYLHQATPRRRISPRGGTTIVLLGCDGAGKSTQSKMLIEWLGKKLDVIPIYFGSGDGPSSFYRLPLRWALRLIGTGPSGKNGDKPNPGPTEERQRRLPELATIKTQLQAAARPIWALLLALEKRGKIRRMVRARNRGMAVVCDRFPQSDVIGFNDGPLLEPWRKHRWRLCRWLADWESQPYASAAQTQPDLVLRMIVDPAVAKQRAPEMTLEELRRRFTAVKSIRFPGATTVIDINADATVDEVTATIKRLVWNRL